MPFREKIRSVTKNKRKVFCKWYCYHVYVIAYNNSDDTVSMLADYAKYMKKYTEMTKKMDDIESMDLNDAENLYFLDVQTRVNAKLAEIQ